MIEAANADFEASKLKSNGEEVEKLQEEEEKKPSTCLSRWEESLLKCSNLSQIFIHLNTLDRSIIWDKSVQNVKCRLCKRKGEIQNLI